MQPLAINKAINLITGISILLFFSCKKFVTVDPPETEIVTSKVFANDKTATAAITVIYSQMSTRDGMTYNIPLYTGMSGDELTNYSVEPSFVSCYTNSLTAQNGVVPTIWNAAYFYIYEANAAIESLNISNGVSPNVKNQLLGEALFIRSFWHFYLTNLFGDVPLMVSTDFSKNSVAGRTSRKEILQKIVTDLISAKGMLTNHFFDGADLAVSEQRTRPTIWAASALLARVYLYQEEWTKAENEASLIILNTDLFILDTPLNVFLKNSSESIWQIEPVFPDSNTPEGKNFILTSGPSTGSGGQTTSLSDELINTFEANDKRFADWVGSIDGIYFPFKYKADGSVSGTVEYSSVFRLAELYLIRAEARAELNNLSDAVADLNIVRDRAGLDPFSSSIQTEVLDKIFHERQIEFFAEWGHRWMDLGRSGRAFDVMPAITTQKGGSWKDSWILYPIPQSERNNDPNLTQNPDY